MHFHAIYQWTMLLVLIHSWLREIQHTNLKALKENWQPNFQEGSIFWQDRLFGGHPATKGSNTPSPPCLNETLNCHACLRYPMRITPSYYWSWTWKKSSRRVGCVWCVGVSGCIDRRLQTSFLFPLEVMSLYLAHAAYKSLLCMQYLSRTILRMGGDSRS